MHGLYYLNDFITEDFSSDIIKSLDEGQWIPLSESANSRLVQHYGYLYDYKTRRVDTPTTPFSSVISELSDKLKKVCVEMGLVDEEYMFNQCIVNNYQPGQGISKHIDIKSYGPVIGCYTLGSGSHMRFSKGDTTRDIYVEPNSLYIMSGDSRSNWTHEMMSRKSDIVDGDRVGRGRRISVTFRSVQ